MLGTPLGIEVQEGSGILLMWAAVVPAILALPLYMIMCVTTARSTLSSVPESYWNDLP